MPHPPHSILLLLAHWHGVFAPFVIHSSFQQGFDTLSHRLDLARRSLNQERSPSLVNVHLSACRTLHANDSLTTTSNDNTHVIAQLNLVCKDFGTVGLAFVGRQARIAAQSIACPKFCLSVIRSRGYLSPQG